MYMHVFKYRFTIFVFMCIRLVNPSLLEAGLPASPKKEKARPKALQHLEVKVRSEFLFPLCLT